MNFKIRIYRHPLAAEAAGVVTVDPAEREAAPGADEAQGRNEEGKDNKSKKDPAETAEDKPKPADKAVTTDWQAYQKMQEKFERNPNARPTKREMALQEKYDGKDEKLIEGWTAQDKPQAAAASDEDAEDAAAESAEKPAAPVIPKELEALVGEKSPIGAKTLADLPVKVKAMAEKIEKMNGDFGAVGRVMQAAGVENLKALSDEIKGAKRLNALVQDLKKGSKEAFEFLGIAYPAQQPQGRRQEPANADDLPDGILDEGLYKHVSPQLKKLQDENAELRRMVTDRLKDVDDWKTDNQTRAAETQRVQQINEVITDVATLVQGNDGLWDAKKFGPLNKALKDYYSTNGEYNPGLKPILEILEIAKKHRLENLDIAFSHWDRSNAATRMRQAREEARLPFTGKQPSVGLSDQQGNHSGQFKEYTKSQVQNMGKKGYPAIPPDWVDISGTFDEAKVPAYARPWLFGDNEE